MGDSACCHHRERLDDCSCFCGRHRSSRTEKKQIHVIYNQNITSKKTTTYIESNWKLNLADEKAETLNTLCFSFRVYKHQSPIYRRLVSKQKSSSTLVCCPRQPFVAASMQKRVVFNYSLTDLKSISMKIMYVASYAKRKENSFC